MNTFLSRKPVLSQEGFIGREELLHWLADLLSRPSPQNCNLTGEPRSGKTSVLYQAYDRRIGLPPGAHGIYVWLRLAGLPDHQSGTFWRTMLVRLQDEQTRAGIERDVQVPQDEREIFDVLDETIELLVGEEDLKRLVFFIDDFDLLLAGIGSQDLDWLRSLATRYGEVLAFVITSSDSLVDLSDQLLAREQTSTAHAVSPFANMFHSRPLGLLTESEAVRLCREAAVSEGQPPLTEDEITFLLQEAGRHPAMLKVACGYLFEARADGESGQIYEDVRGDVRLDGQVSWLCRRLWERRSRVERDTLAALVEGKPVADEIVLTFLKKHLGLVERRCDNLTLFADAFAYWVGRELQKSEAPPVVAETAVSQAAVPAAGELNYIPEQRLAIVDEQEIRLTSLESRLLAYFLAHKNSVRTVDDLLSNVWGPGKTRAVVEKAVNRLRAKIEHDPKRPRFILNARGEGYLLRLD
jgi:hypothetical protein